MKLLTLKRRIFTFIILISSFASSCNSKTPEVPVTPEEIVNTVDFLTPEYYNSESGFIVEVNNFIDYVQQEQFHNPLENDIGVIPSYEVKAQFGSEKGDGDEHHAAVDLHVGDREVNVNLYASHGGIVSTVKNAFKYRQYISITKQIKDESNNLLGKLVTIYAHVDLDLDEAESLFMDGQVVLKGDLISKNLYSETVGGPHLHFEIRYYRATDVGNETFYGFTNTTNPELTEPSAGQWIFGTWSSSIGYGFANPTSHGLNF